MRLSRVKGGGRCVLLRVKQGGLCIYLEWSVVNCAFTESKTRWIVRLLKVNRRGLCGYFE